MTTTKKYRAATLREALEQIKRELGENALVLDSKNVRVGGFLGVNAHDMVEVSVAVPEDFVERPVRPAAPAPRAGSFLSLNLADDTPAAPVPQHSTPAQPEQQSAAYARPSAVPAHAPAVEIPAQPRTPEAPALNELPQRGIELAETAPRVVHRGTNAAAQPKPSPEPNIEPAAAQSRPGTSSEFERLRAELREMKFYLGTLAARGAGQDSMLREEAARSRVNRAPQSGFLELFNELTSTGIPADFAEHILTTTTDADILGVGGGLDARSLLEGALPSFMPFAEDLFAPQQTATVDGTIAAAFVGPTGVGKTTTIAKLAARLSLREGRRIELITMDTIRIGALEQLKAYADIIGAGFNVVRTTLELDVLVRRLSREAAVLIDTMGRNPHDLADQMELADYLAAQRRIRKCLVIQATTHPADALATVRKYALCGVDRLVLTKLDETSRPGASLGVAAESALPLTYLCAGQRVPEDIEPATPQSFARRLLRGGHSVAYATAA